MERIEENRPELDHVHPARGAESGTLCRTVVGPDVGTASALFLAAKAPEDLRPLLVRLRAQLARSLPDAEEIIAYKMPGFRIGTSIIVPGEARSKISLVFGIGK